jgi:alpha-L-fucosidase
MRKTENWISLVMVFLSFLHFNISAQTVNNNQLEKTKEFFREAKFGMFIHWGVYSIPAGEYNGKEWDSEWVQLHAGIMADDYEKIAQTFNPLSFDADRWMKIAKQAGIKYIVFTAKHHDGFCMFKSDYTNYNIVDFTPYKKDIVKMLSDACIINNIKLGLYYSIVDWHYPDFPPIYSQLYNFHGRPNPNADINKYAVYQYNQLKELMTNYGPVSFAWFDGGGGFKDVDRYKLLRGDSVIQMIRKYQPGCMINNRIGITADYGTLEQTVPGSIQDQAFETCMTMNDNWGYAKNDNHWKSTKELVRTLIEVAHKGGNLLLNVGPDSNGNIPDSSVVRLQGMGRWLDVNGESIYGTRNSLWELPNWGRSTTRFLENGNSVLYFHIYNWPQDNVLLIPDLKNKAIKAFVLTSTGKKYLTFNQHDRGISINLKTVNQDEIAIVVGLEVSGQKFELKKMKNN